MAKKAKGAPPPATEDTLPLDPAIAAALRLCPDPGIYEGLTDNDYHDDPCPEPSLSRTVLKALVDLSPAHAYCLHPRLGGIRDPDAGSENEIADFGTAAHASFLQNRSIIKRLDFPDWRTNNAKDARTLAYAEGMIPLLSKSYSRAMRLIDVLEDFRARTGAFTKGRGEQTVVWREGAAWCRARVDWLPDDPAESPFDLKTTAGVATLEAWSRIAFGKGADLQDGFYARGLEIVRGEPPAPMLFAVVEQRPPHAIGVFEMSPIARESADDDIRFGLSTWDECMAAGSWPSYTMTPQQVFPPSWVLRSREERGRMSQRATELLREMRDRPLGVRMVEQDDFGG
jgi:hypothetical protein